MGGPKGWRHSLSRLRNPPRVRGGSALQRGPAGSEPVPILKLRIARDSALMRAAFPSAQAPGLVLETCMFTAFAAEPHCPALHLMQGQELASARPRMGRRRLLQGLPIVLFGALLGSIWPFAARSQTLAPVAQSALPTGAILQGIISYTAWPQRPQALNLCISRSAPDAADIARDLPPLHDGRSLEIRWIEANQALPTHCHAVFLDGWQSDALRKLLQSLADQAVLTLGRGPEFCSDGGMFCLQAVEGRTRFEVNLDAVARSGLRVHPQVLRLAKPAPRKV